MDHAMTVGAKDREICRHVVRDSFPLAKACHWPEVMRLNKAFAK